MDVFFPKAQIQAHSAGTVKLASDHWLSTYWPITGPTLPTRASLWGGEKRKGDVNAAAELGDDAPELPLLAASRRRPYAERRFSLVSLSAKMCTVPLSLEAHRKEESWLKLMLRRTKGGDARQSKPGMGKLRMRPV